MAIGDNIPKIFGNLAETSMKSRGDFQYHLDLLNNVDPDESMALRDSVNSPFGPPAPMDGPLVDQFLLMSGNDPMAATDMTLQESLMEMAPDNTELNKNELAAQALYGYSPGPIDPILLNTFADNMGINSSDLQIGLDKVDAITQFNMLDNFATTSGENLIQAIPGSPDDEPPPGRGPIGDDDPPPFVPDSSDYNTSLFPFPLWKGIPRGGIDPTYLPQTTWGDLGEAIGNIGSTTGKVADFLLPGRSGESYIAPSNELDRLVPNYQELTEPELDAAIERTIIEKYDPSTRASLEQNDPLIANALAQEKESLKQMFDPSENIVLEDFAPAPEGLVTSAATPPEWRGRSGELPQGMDASAIAGMGPQVSATYDPNSLPATFTDLDPSQQWGPYMQQVLPNYYAPGVQDAYSRAYQPFYGTYLLSPDIGEFSSFMHEYKPEQFPQFDWNAFDPQWSQVLDYSEGQQGSDVATVQGSSRDLAEINSKLFTALTGSDAPNNAIALAMARYNEGNIVEPSYGNKLLQEALTTMFNLQQREDLYKGDTNTTANFLASLAEINPERFGR